jgi:hypothetical protein
MCRAATSSVDADFIPDSGEQVPSFTARLFVIPEKLELRRAREIYFYSCARILFSIVAQFIFIPAPRVYLIAILRE